MCTFLLLGHATFRAPFRVQVAVMIHACKCCLQRFALRLLMAMKRLSWTTMMMIGNLRGVMSVLRVRHLQDITMHVCFATNLEGASLSKGTDSSVRHALLHAPVCFLCTEGGALP